jgi:drug/metabolite transporter (DMT)-like permease
MSSSVYALLSIITWSATLLMVRAAGQVWPTLTLGAYSRVVTVVLLGAFLLSTGRGWRRLSVAAVWRLLLVMGAISIVVNALFFWGLSSTSATSASVLYRLDLLFVMLIGTAMGYERVHPLGWLVVPVMAVGVGLLMEVQKINWQGHLLGDTMIVVSAFGLAVNAFIIRRIVKVVDGRVVAFYNLIISGLGLFAITAWRGALRPPTDTAGLADAWVWPVAVGLIIAFQLPLYYAALRRMLVWKLRALMLLSPLMVAGVEVALLKTALHPGQWVGSALIVLGAGALIAYEHNYQAPSMEPARAEGDAAGRPTANTVHGPVMDRHLGASQNH